MSEKTNQEPTVDEMWAAIKAQWPEAVKGFDPQGFAWVHSSEEADAVAISTRLTVEELAAIRDAYSRLPAPQEPTVDETHEQMLGSAIVRILFAAGVTTPQPMTGPELVQFANEYASHLESPQESKPTLEAVAAQMEEALLTCRQGFENLYSNQGWDIRRSSAMPHISAALAAYKEVANG